MPGLWPSCPLIWMDFMCGCQLGLQWSSAAVVVVVAAYYITINLFSLHEQLRVRMGVRTKFAGCGRFCYNDCLSKFSDSNWRIRLLSIARHWNIEQSVQVSSPQGTWIKMNQTLKEARNVMCHFLSRFNVNCHWTISHSEFRNIFCL